MKYYIVYKIINLLNGKVYIGVHQTDDLNDDYVGSGKYLKRAIEKHGQENFIKEIIQCFDNPEDMFSLEKEMVNEEFVKRNDTYNLKEGGEGGWGYVNKLPTSKKSRDNSSVMMKNLIKKMWSDPLFVKRHKTRSSNIMKKNRENGKCLYNFLGKKHTEETLRKMKEIHKTNNHQKGEKNSHFGKCWIYNEQLKENKSIKKEELDSWIGIGWCKGRKMKF